MATKLTKEEVKSLQKRMNAFVKLYLDGLGPIMVDGVMGGSTNGRILTCKWYLGYDSKTGRRGLNADPNHDFRSRLWHPKNLKYTTPARLARSLARRSKQRRDYKKSHKSGTTNKGVGTYDGRQVANWMIPYLKWAREHGWQGTVSSGWRDPVYSQSLCYNMCGHASCPGKCAGLSSNHVGSEKPHGAVDVTDYVRFGQLMRSCPLSPRLWNNLPVDRVHYSASGN